MHDHMNMHLVDEYDMADEHSMLDWMPCIWCLDAITCLSWLPCDVSALEDICLLAMINEWLGLGWLCHVDFFRCMLVCVCELD